MGVGLTTGRGDRDPVDRARGGVLDERVTPAADVGGGQQVGGAAGEPDELAVARDRRVEALVVAGDTGGALARTMLWLVAASHQKTFVCSRRSGESGPHAVG